MPFIQGRIAGVRLTLYTGSGLIILTEIYRFCLIYIGFILQGTLLLSIFEAIISWGLFLGFLNLTLGFHLLNRHIPPLLPSEEFDFQKLNPTIMIGTFICILTLIYNLSPPAGTGSEFGTFFIQILINIVWSSFYALLSVWLIYVYSFTHSTSLRQSIRNRKFLLHLLLAIILTVEWITQTVIIFFSIESFLTPQVFTAILSGTMVFFLLFQIYYFYKLSRFSYLIKG